MRISDWSSDVCSSNVLVGAIGVSGDGIDQDDMIGFLGLHNAGARVGGFGNAPAAIRPDQIVVDLGNANVRLRYVTCTFAPFLESEIGRAARREREGK